MKRYSAVVFDWDGTLMDSTHSIASSIQGACRDLSFPVPSDSEARWVIGLSLDIALYRLVPDLTAEQYPLFLESYKEHFHKQDTQLSFFEGVPELVSGLRQKKVMLGVATGKSRAGLDRMLQAQQWHHHFDITRCADESFGKPHPGMLLDIMQSLDLQPEQVLMVGDTSHDVLMARNAGMDSLAVSYGAHDKSTLLDSQPTVMVDTVDAMRGWLDGRVVELN
ncbi:HAD-IA family hydrolase [Eoetvoesiella caeni]